MSQEQLKRRRILVVEDARTVAQDLAARLTAAGAEVIGPVRRLEDALSLLELSDPDGAVLPIDLDGSVATTLLVALRFLAIPVVLAMDDVSAFPDYWTEKVPRVTKPVALADLAEALEAAVSQTDLRFSVHAHDHPARRATLARLVESHARARERLQKAIEVEAAFDAPVRADVSLPVIEIDASNWRNELDLYAAFGAALGIPGHSTNLDGWLEILLDGAVFGAREPPYTIRIVNAAQRGTGVRWQIALLAAELRRAREEWGDNPQVDITVVS